MTEWIEVHEASFVRSEPYKNKAEIQADYDADRDFREFSGRYVNRQDARKYGLVLMVRYGKGYSKVMPVEDKEVK
jgi:hypothetical protein